MFAAETLALVTVSAVLVLLTRTSADAGCSTHEIAAWSGHLTLREVERYTKGANQKRLAASGLAKVMTSKPEQFEAADCQPGQPRLSNSLK
jgi:hypothetical protein